MNFLQDLQVSQVPLNHQTMEIGPQSIAGKLVDFNKRSCWNMQHLGSDREHFHSVGQIKYSHLGYILLWWMQKDLSGNVKVTHRIVLLSSHQIIESAKPDLVHGGHSGKNM